MLKRTTGEVTARGDRDGEGVRVSDGDAAEERVPLGDRGVSVNEGDWMTKALLEREGDTVVKALLEALTAALKEAEGDGEALSPPAARAQSSTRRTSRGRGESWQCATERSTGCRRRTMPMSIQYIYKV